jgi:filamentous hemagglutinin family protein
MPHPLQNTPTRRPAPATTRRGADPRLAPVALACLMALSGLPVSAQPPATQLPVQRPGSAPINATIAPVAGSAVRPVMNITQTPAASNRAVIEWSGFNIGSQATVNIAQPNAQSVLVNRVVSEGPRSASEIYGSLNANGRVFVVNPAGVIFGPGAQVNVGSLVASALDFSDAASSNGYRGFLEGGSVELVSGADAASVQVMESAAIRTQPGGSVVLVAGQGVSQHGAIEAAQGRVDLAVASQAAVLPLGTSGFVDLVIAPSAAPSGKASIDVGGSIDTSSANGNGGSVRIDAGSEGRVTLGQNASVRADSSAADGTGGRIDVLGRRIALEATAPVGAPTLSADGTRSGGRIEVGSAATRDLHIAQGALLSAEATGSGDGGTINARATYRADDVGATTSVAREDYGVAEVYGHLRVRGGTAGGNGGFVDTSGTALNTTLFDPATGTTLRADVDARARAAGGLTGTWLLDPFNVLISNTASVATTDTTDNNGDRSFTPSGAGANLLASDLSTALQNANVIVSTGDTATGTEIGTITVASGVNLTGAATAGATNSLTLTAHDSIVFQTDTSIRATAGQLNVNLIADNDSNGVGAVQLTNATIATGGGNLAITGASSGNTNIASVSVAGTTLDTQGGNGQGNISITGTNTTDARGVSITGSSLLGNNISILGQTARASAVYFDNSTLGTTSGLIEVRGVAARIDGGFGQNTGVEIDSLTINLGSGNLTIAGRADDANRFTSGGGSPIGLQYSDLRINTQQNGGKIILAGEAAGSDSTDARGITFLDAESGGLTLSAGVSANNASLHDIEIGAITSNGLALDLGTGSGINVATNGAINFRPLGVNAAGDVVESPDTPITVGDLGALDGGVNGFAVDTAWLRGPNQGGFSTARGFVIGSQQHSADINVLDEAFNAGTHSNVSVTLQNQGPGLPTSEGPVLGNIFLGADNTLRDLILFTSGGISQGGPLTVQRYLLLRAGGDVDLSDTQNSINTLTFDTTEQGLTLATQGNLTVDAFANLTPILYDAANDAFPIYSFTPTPGNRNFNRGGTSVSLRAGGQVFLNTPIDMLSNTAVVDITSPTQVTLGTGFEFTTLTQPLDALASARIWAPVISNSTGARNLYGCVFGDTGTCSVSGIALPTAGRQDLYPTQPTLTVSASTGTDGQGNPVVNLSGTGLINGDTLQGSLSGAPASTPGSQPGTVDFSIGTLASPTGYVINFIGGSGAARRILSANAEAVRTSYLAEFRSDVYGRNLAMPYVCTAASVVRETLARETNADPLAAEWGKVRGQPHLSGCLVVADGGQCAAF